MKSLIALISLITMLACGHRDSKEGPEPDSDNQQCEGYGSPSFNLTLLDNSDKPVKDAKAEVHFFSEKKAYIVSLKYIPKVKLYYEYGSSSDDDSYEFVVVTVDGQEFKKRKSYHEETYCMANNNWEYTMRIP